jgi:hypothetical protein
MFPHVTTKVDLVVGDNIHTTLDIPVIVDFPYDDANGYRVYGLDSPIHTRNWDFINANGDVIERM